MKQDDFAGIGLAAMVGDRYLAQTHEVLNQPAALVDYNLYTTDRALQEAVGIQGGQAAEAALPAFGVRTTLTSGIIPRGRPSGSSDWRSGSVRR